MPQEIEVKFLRISHADIRRKLTSLKAELKVPMRTMRRSLFDYPDGRLQKNNWGRIRVRNEIDKITLAYKSGEAGEYAQELETAVSSYDATVAILEAIGLSIYTFEESKRETWELEGVEVVLDEWPHLLPYIEIEGETESAIRRCAESLGFDWDQAVRGNVDVAYRDQYKRMGPDETIGSIPELLFNQPLPAWLEERQ